MRHGAPFIRVMFIAVVLAMVIKLLWDQPGAGRHFPERNRIRVPRRRAGAGRSNRPPRP
jgi:hypothetical protein